MRRCLWEAVWEAQHTVSTEVFSANPATGLSEGKCVITAGAPRGLGVTLHGQGRLSGSPRRDGTGLTCLRGRGADDDGGGGHQADGGAQPVPGPRVHHQSTRLVVVSGRGQHGVTWGGKAQTRGKAMNNATGGGSVVFGRAQDNETVKGKSEWKKQQQLCFCMNSLQLHTGKTSRYKRLIFSHSYATKNAT